MPVKLAVVGMIGLGSAALWLSWRWWDSGYLPNIMLQIGSSLLLFVPLFALERSFTTAADRRVSLLREQIEEFRARDEARADQFAALQNFAAATGSVVAPSEVIELAVASVMDLLTAGEPQRATKLRVSVFEVFMTSNQPDGLTTKLLSRRGPTPPGLHPAERSKTRELWRDVLFDTRYAWESAETVPVPSEVGTDAHAFLAHPIASGSTVHGFLLIEALAPDALRDGDMPALGLWTTLLANQMSLLR